MGNTGEHSIGEVAQLIAHNLEYNNSIIWDSTKPSGQFRKPSTNQNLLQLGWRPGMYTSFEKALENACNWFLTNYPNIRGI